MADINYIPTGYRQLGDICLLASYSAALGYYQNIINGNRNNHNIDELLHQYINYISSLLCATPNEHISTKALGEKLIQLENAIKVELVSKPKNPSSVRRLYENYISIVLHWYCQCIRSSAKLPNGLHGYQHIKEFDDFLMKQKDSIRPNNFQIIDHKEQSSPIPEAYNTIKKHLDTAEHNIAMLLFQVKGDFHSIMIAQDKKSIIYRDSNQLACCRDCATFGFQFNEHSQIQEYILFQLIDNQ